MGADDERDPAIQMMRERQLLAGGLGMHVDDDSLHRAAQRVLGELGVQRPERIVGQRHEQAAEHLQDEHALAARGADLGDAAARACPAPG